MVIAYESPLSGIGSADDLQLHSHLWVLPYPVARQPGLLQRWRTYLDPVESARYRRYLRDADRVQFLTAHGFLREVLSRYSSMSPPQWSYRYASDGRPELSGQGAESGLRFNLSHTQGLVAVIVTRKIDCGVDVERIERGCAHLPVARRMFAAEECQNIERAQPDRLAHDFMQYWTLKEAYAKACGRGLRIPTRDVVFSIQAAGKVNVEFRNDLDEAGQWQFSLNDYPGGYCMATALRCGRGEKQGIVLVDGVQGLGL